MLHSLLKISLANRNWFLFAALALSLYGAYSLSRLPIDAVPDITNIQVMVNTKTGALDPEQIEKTVTYYIESELAGLPRVEEIRSLSKFGLSQVIVIFHEGTDIYWARQMVSERLQNVRDLVPSGINPEMAPITTGLGEVLMYVLLPRPGSALAKKKTYEQLLYLRTIQDYVIRPGLKQVQGVADVDSGGGYRKEIHVNLFPRKLEAYGITLHRVIEKLNTLGENFGGGYIQSGGRQIIVRSSNLMRDLKYIRRLPVKRDVFGRTIPLEKIADIRADHSLRVGAATYNGEETVLGTVLMLKGANSRTVARDSEEALKKIRLPEDVRVQIVYSRSYLVNSVIQTVSKNLAEGAGLVILILLLILGNFRAALIVSLAIPFSMLIAASGMKFLNISANLMSLGAIDFGLLVDASVDIVENVLRKMEEPSARERIKTQADKLALIFEAARETVRPVVLGLFIIMTVYVPILFLEGVEGKLFKPMAQTVLMALFASLLAGVFIMPALAYIFIKQPGTGSPHKEPLFFRLIQRGYRPALELSLKKPMFFIIPALVFALGAGFLYTRLGSDFIPEFDEGDLVIGLVRKADISIDESVRRQMQSEKAMLKLGEAKTIFSRMGTPDSATDPMGVNFADTFVILKKNAKNRPRVQGRLRSKTEIFEAMKKTVHAAVPGQEISSTQPIEMRFNEILEGSRADVTLRIFGPDLDTLLVLLEKAKGELQKLKGVEAAELDALTALKKSPVLDIIPLPERLAYYGVSLNEVNRTLSAFMGGYQVGSFYENERRYPIIVHLDESLRNRREALRNLPIALPGGGVVPLRLLAKFQYNDKVTTIARGWARRYAAVSVYLKNRDIASFVAEAKSVIKKKVPLPENYHLEWGGQFKNLERARTRLFIIIPIMLVVIFLLLLRNFRNIRHALLVYFSIPFAVTGGIFSLYLRGIPFSISAAVGFIALSGIAVLNSMVLVVFINQLRKKGTPLLEAVREGAMIRLRPVIMTALVASLGFIPMALNTGLGAEVQRPLATVVVGGLVSSTILTLLLLPLLYAWLENRRKNSRKKD